MASEVGKDFLDWRFVCGSAQRDAQFIHQFQGHVFGRAPEGVRRQDGLDHIFEEGWRAQDSAARQPFGVCQLWLPARRGVEGRKVHVEAEHPRDLVRNLPALHLVELFRFDDDTLPTVVQLQLDHASIGKPQDIAKCV